MHMTLQYVQMHVAVLPGEKFTAGSHKTTAHFACYKVH